MNLEKVIDLLQLRYGPRQPHLSNDPLELILWENVLYLADDAERAAAFQALKTKIGLKPHDILAASAQELREITSTGGIVPEIQIRKLYRIASIARDEFNGDLRPILKKPAKLAMKDLRKFPAIGEPSAEKILLFTRTVPALALESNGLRVLVRLGYAEEQTNYSTTYRKVREAVAPQLPNDCDALIRAHELLRHHGKTLCKRARPLCCECPLTAGCKFFNKGQ